MPEAARLTDQIAHSDAMVGLLAGALAGALIGAFCVVTGGAGAALIVALAATGAGVGEVLGSTSLFPSVITGAIASASADVEINLLGAARAHLDSVASCAGLPPLMFPPHGPMLLAQGSKTVTINGMPAARKGDMLTCSAKIDSGSANVIIGGPAATTDEISPEIPLWLNAVIGAIGFFAAWPLAGFWAALLGLGGSLGGGYLASQLGGKWFGEGSDKQKFMGLGGAILGGLIGGAVGKSIGDVLAGKGAVTDANFAQAKIRADETFSPEGSAKYSNLAGRPINNVDDLAGAIKDGTVKPNQVPLDYVRQPDGSKLILNSRTSAALDRAGVPKSDWYGVDQTGKPVPGMDDTTFNDLANRQLENNDLPSSGSPDIPKGRN